MRGYDAWVTWVPDEVEVCEECDGEGCFECDADMIAEHIGDLQCEARREEERR
jgi:hypothetical protein